MYDIIGDIHGHADELSELLEQLGYERQQGVYRHPTRTAVFVGDFIDRGPQIREALSLIRAMHSNQTALAVMGNHEFNALAYHTPDPDEPGEFLRKHSEKNTKQHSETLRQISDDELLDHLEWFRQLPMWLDLEGVRIVHACWDPDSMTAIESHLQELGGVSAEFLSDAIRQGTRLFDAIEAVLKGKEVKLPDGFFYHDKDGNPRTMLRVKWYRSPVNETFDSYSLSVDEGLPPGPFPPELTKSIQPYPAADAPVFFGHYWLRSEVPSRLAANVACVDYSVAKGGMLCAYRWDGERLLSDDKFVTVPSNESASTE